MKFQCQVWRPRPEIRGAAPDTNALADTHILIADDVRAESPADLDADVTAVMLTNNRHVEAVADALELAIGDIIVCSGRAYSVDWDKVVFIGTCDVALPTTSRLADPSNGD
jgi:hypothetical protein